ncbi:MAG: hypothetical protein B6D59_01020 [Campylobacteraceae bacterium 4484_4]|nr:MAG: hypothetical protein B6D59_01020 [Campylobacteraceae bacterium 4484_4]
MKKPTIHFLGFIEFGILFGTLLLFILAAPQSLRYIVDRASEGTMLSYHEISGNLLRTVTLTDLRFEEEKIADEAIIDWNFKALLYGELKIDDIELHGVDLEVAKKWLDALVARYATKEKKEKSSFPVMRIENLFFSTRPYRTEGINIDRFEVQMQQLKADPDGAEIGNFVIDTISDHFNITADGTLRHKDLHFYHLWIDRINLSQIIPTIKRYLLTSRDKKAPKKRNPLQNPHVESLHIDDFKATMVPYRIYKEYRVHRGVLSAKSLSSDLKTIEAKRLTADADFNVGSAYLKGAVKKSTFFAKGSVHLKQSFFDRSVTKYVDIKALNPLDVALKADFEKLTGQVISRCDRLFPHGRVPHFNLAIHKATTNVKFEYRKLDVTAQTDANLSTTLGKNWHLYNYFHFSPKKSLAYQGVLYAPTTSIFPVADGLLKQSTIQYRGGIHTLEANLSAPLTTATFTSKGYKDATLHIRTKRITAQKAGIQLPTPFSLIEGDLKSDITFNLRNINTLKATLLAHSNLTDLEGTYRYQKGLHLQAKATLPKKHIWSQISPDLKPAQLFPADISLDYRHPKLSFGLKNTLFSNNLEYDLNSSIITESFRSDESNLTAGGKFDSWLTFQASTRSLRTLQQTLSRVYRFTPRPLDGEVTLKGSIKDGKVIDATLLSRWMVYEYRPYHFAFAEKIRSDFTLTKEKLTLKNYYFSTYLDHDRIFFANKPSTITFSPLPIRIDRLWINDQATVTGEYNPKSQKGRFKAHAARYHYKDLEGDLTFSADIQADLDRNSTAISGNVLIDGGVVTYQPRKQHYVQDDDIIIVQEEAIRKALQKSSALTVDLSVITKKPIRYKTPQIDAYFDLDLKFWKEKQKDLELLGIAKVLSGTYRESNKVFRIEPGEILFGGPILNPYLNLSATYKGDPYLITIVISGTLESPILNFSSSPYLSQSDILSYLLFDSTTENLFSAKQSSSATAIKLFGNTFAKEIVSTFGIKLDRLVLSTTEEGGLGIEVGKRLTKNVTLIYINDVVSTIKIKYQISRQFETEITISPESSGIDFLYNIEH